MTTHPLSPQQMWAKRLQQSSQTKFEKLLRSLCKVHQDSEWSVQAFGFLNPKATPKGVDWNGLLNLSDSLSSQKYDDARQHFRANQFASLIRKYPFPAGLISINPREEAKKTFLNSELRCSRVNRRFLLRDSLTRVVPPFEFELDCMRKFISYVIGNEPRYSHILNKTGFGPGASIGVHGNATNVWRKLSSRWTVSPGAYHFAFASVMTHAQVREVIFPNPGGFTSGGSDYDPFTGPFSKKVDVITYNKISFVPKTAKTHRVIAVEPLLNSFVQKGVDLHFRERLLRIGIDLSDQEKNSEFARLGSLAGEEDPFCTIDLSSASDSISQGLVKNLLPPAWYEFLDRIRSQTYMLDGAIRPYHKFCSMGNGFCFPLETLLFCAACQASGAGTAGKDYLVYGDDIVVRQSVAHKLVKLLAFMGFKTNSRKTFLEGPFRESCGKDWFGGVDVRPYTLDYALDSIQSLFKFLNGSNSSELRKEFFGPVRSLVLSWVPEQFRFFRPYPGPEDTAIDSQQDEFLTSPHCSYRSFGGGNGCWRWKELLSTAIPDRYRHAQDNAYALVYAALTGSASNMPFSLRRKTKTKVRFVSHPGATSLWLPLP